MITRRNWLLRCSIIINIVVLVYICSQLVYRDNSLQLPPAASAYLLQQNGGGGGVGADRLQVDQMGRKQLSLDSPPPPNNNNNNNNVMSSNSNNINNNMLTSNLISANGIGASNNDAQPVSGLAATGTLILVDCTLNLTSSYLVSSLHRFPQEWLEAQKRRIIITIS